MKRKNKRIFEINVFIDGNIKFTTEEMERGIQTTRDRLITSGLQVLDEEKEVFTWYPPHRIDKVTYRWIRSK